MFFFFPTPTRALKLTLLALALFQIAIVSASPMPAPQALPLNLVSDLAPAAHTNMNNANNNNALLTAAPNTNTNANTPTPTDNRDVKHTSSLGSPLDLESLPLLGSLDSAVPMGVHDQNVNTGSGSGASHPSGPLSLLGRRAVYISNSNVSPSSTGYTQGLDANWEEGATKLSSSMPVAVGRAERFRARLMRRARAGA